ncbi:MAG: AglZ/HisF2 family acetamidino modification protein [Labilithrix sp.]|nr:AglZ/HisF2 family acetamidino modification protein [Labilithrix sp.]MCW5814750.1 AglZ/HisF2 family acetamidino modification protein [Labilithrix sp.]
MLSVRVIPVLLLRRSGLVKTVRFRNAAYVGDPINIVRIFSEKEVDELILTEIRATKDGKRPDFELLEQIASEAFMPICYGGGVRSVDDATRILRLGMEKVSINTAALERPSLVQELATELGSQCVVASVDVQKDALGRYQVFSHADRPVPETNPLRWIDRLIRLGAGEILLNAVDRDGTMEGFDLTLLRLVRGRFDVPVIACGGASDLGNMRAAVREGALSAVGVGARFIYEGPYRAVLVSYLTRSEIESLSAGVVS